MNSRKIKKFTDLMAWQKAHRLLIEIYKITREYPKEELYVLVSQMRRCALSITSNIAEGFTRKSKKEKRQFYYISASSLTELQNQLLASRDLGYINNEKFSEIASRTVSVYKLINGLIRSSKSKK